MNIVITVVINEASAITYNAEVANGIRVKNTIAAVIIAASNEQAAATIPICNL